MSSLNSYAFSSPLYGRAFLRGVSKRELRRRPSLAGTGKGKKKFRESLDFSVKFSTGTPAALL